MLSWAYVTPDQWIRNIRGSEWEMLWARYMSSATYNICYSRVDLSTVPEDSRRRLCTWFEWITLCLTDDIKKNMPDREIAHSVPKSALFDTMIRLMADQRRLDNDL